MSSNLPAGVRVHTMPNGRYKVYAEGNTGEWWPMGGDFATYTDAAIFAESVAS